MTERLDPDALRELFLFERLDDGQLVWLAERGQVTSYEAGATIYRTLERMRPAPREPERPFASIANPQTTGRA